MSIMAETAVTAAQGASKTVGTKQTPAQTQGQRDLCAIYNTKTPGGVFVMPIFTLEGKATTNHIIAPNPGFTNPQVLLMSISATELDDFGRVTGGQPRYAWSEQTTDMLKALKIGQNVGGRIAQQDFTESTLDTFPVGQHSRLRKIVEKNDVKYINALAEENNIPCVDENGEIIFQDKFWSPKGTANDVKIITNEEVIREVNALRTLAGNSSSLKGKK